MMQSSVSYSISTSGMQIYWPDHRPLRGGLVCLHGSEGGYAGWNDLQCALFAANGFAAMAMNYTLKADWHSRPDIDDVPLDKTEAALFSMRERLPKGCGLGLFGNSRGAEQALLLAQLLAEDGSLALPDAVAVHSPPDTVWPAFIVADFKIGGAWDGDPDRPAWSWRGGHERTRPGLPLRAERFPGPVFLAQGTQDTVWSADLARRLVARLTEAGRPPEAHFFEGEDHSFRPEARNREWDLLTAFFGRHLAPASNAVGPASD